MDLIQCNSTDDQGCTLGTTVSAGIHQHRDEGNQKWDCSKSVLIFRDDRSGDNGSKHQDQKPGDTVTPPTTEEKPSVPNIPSVDEKPGNTDEPTVDETPSIPEKPEVTPPTVEEKPDNSIGNDTINSEQSFMAEVERAIYNKVNEERAKAGVSSLTYNDVMQKYARIKSKDMGDNNYFSHEDLSGNLITTQMRNDGVSYKAWGENIAYIGGNMSADALAQQFMTNWMNSSGHRANILSDNFSSIGVGVYKIGNKVYATQEFYK